MGNVRARVGEIEGKMLRARCAEKEKCLVSSKAEARLNKNFRTDGRSRLKIDLYGFVKVDYLIVII